MKNYFLNENSSVTVDFERGTIVEIILFDKSIGRGKVPLFAVKMRNEKGESHIVTAFDCKYVFFDEQKASYSHKDFDIDIFVSEKCGELLWRASVTNKTADLIEWVELASFGVCERLKDEEGGCGEIVYPYNEGVLVTDMKKRMMSPFPYLEPEYPSLGRFSIFPNMISSQFLAYITEGSGVYLGFHDEDRTTKHIDFCYGEGCIKLQMRTFCNADYGENYDMSFWLCMTFFHGDYFDACELYRKWFESHLPSGLSKIVATEGLPAWYEESPVIIVYPIRGKFDTDTMEPNKLYPYKNALRYLREISKKTQSKVMSLLMHWEGTAPWAPPYVWPPYGGEKQFEEYVAAAHSENMLVGLYCSGMGWTQHSNLIKSYHKESVFTNEKLNEVMCSDSDGSLRSLICTEQRSGYDFCPACEKSKEILVNEFNKVVRCGVDYVQILDQNHGGNSYFCYSKQHPHVPAPGKWQAEETNKLLARLDKGQTVLGCESAAAEPFLHNLKFSDNRFNLNYYIGSPIPVYSFIYHEYVNNFMGNQICMALSKEKYNYSFRCAYSFIAGDMLTAVIDDKGEIAYCWGRDCFKSHTDRESSLTILKNLNGWRRKGGKKFLHTGRMIKPLPIVCGKNRFVIENGTILQVDEALTSAYEFCDERVQFIVNYNFHSIKVNLAQRVDVYTDSSLTTRLENIDELEIQPLSAVMLKIN